MAMSIGISVVKSDNTLNFGALKLELFPCSVNKTLLKFYEKINTIFIAYLWNVVVSSIKIRWMIVIASTTPVDLFCKHVLFHTCRE